MIMKPKKKKKKKKRKKEEGTSYEFNLLQVFFLTENIFFILNLQWSMILSFNLSYFI